MTIYSHKDLEVWEISMELVTDIYALTKNYPREEIYGLTSQLSPIMNKLQSVARMLNGLKRSLKKRNTQPDLQPPTSDPQKAYA